MSNIKIKAIDTLRESTSKGCRFISFVYATKGTGELSRYTINFGIDYHAACKHDKDLLEAYAPKDELEETAKAEMLQSLTETLTDGVSSSYTQKDTFEPIGKGIRQHKETGEIYIYGYVEGKDQLAPPITPKKDVKSRPLTLAKKAIEKACGFRRSKFGQFVLNPDNITNVSVCGETLTIA